MPTKRSAQLADAMRSRRLVRFSRRFEPWTIRGYVMDVGPRFFLFALVSDRMWFDGFECFRCSDVKDLRPDPYASFAEAALKKRGERRPKKLRVDLTTIEELLVSAGRAFPLVTIQREQVDPSVCWIGHVLGVERGRVSLLEIGPDAKWESSPEEYRVSEITRVSFGGEYENALHLVGGTPGVMEKATQNVTVGEPSRRRLARARLREGCETGLAGIGNLEWSREDLHDR